MQLPIKISLRYSLIDTFLFVWEEVHGKHPYRLWLHISLSVIGFIFSLKVATQVFSYNMLFFILMVIGCLVMAYDCVRIVFILIIIPVLSYFRFRLLGIIHIEYSEVGVHVNFKKEDIFQEWGIYSEIVNHYSSYELKRRDGGFIPKIPKRLIKDRYSLEAFYDFVEQQINKNKA